MTIKDIFEGLLATMPVAVQEAEVRDDEGVDLGYDLIDLVTERLDALKVPAPDGRTWV